MKICNKCGIEKVEPEFARSAESGRLRLDCRSCVSATKVAAWKALHPEAAAAAKARWAAKNKAYLANYRAKRNKTRRVELAARSGENRAIKLRAMPAWASPERIAEVYQLAARLTKETGIEHHVDHVVPLRSKIVSGLHVEYNLEAIPAVKNRIKGNRHWPDMPEPRL
jgi:hypothetical protein